MFLSRISCCPETAEGRGNILSRVKLGGKKAASASENPSDYGALCSDKPSSSVVFSQPQPQSGPGQMSNHRNLPSQSGKSGGGKRPKHASGKLSKSRRSEEMLAQPARGSLASEHATLRATELELAVLGAPKVGKTALVSQFQWGIFIDEHSATVEDLNWIEYELADEMLTLKIIDTSGSHDFIAMRNLRIQRSDAFIVVFAVDDPDSFLEACQIYGEIKKGNRKDMPVQVVATKIDKFSDDSEWPVSRVMIDRFVSENRASLAEVSIKQQPATVENIFRQLLQQKRSLPSGANNSWKKRRQSTPAVTSTSRSGGSASISKEDLDRLKALDQEKKGHRNGSCIIS